MQFNREKYIERLSAMRGNGLVKLITGGRCVGKSVLLNELLYRELIRSGVQGDKIIRFSFDSDEDIALLTSFSNGESVKNRDRKNGHIVNSKIFRRYIASRINEGEQYYLLLDDVHYLENFTGTLSLYQRYPNLDLFVTCANSQYKQHQMADDFRTRSIEVHLLPLTFSEYLKGTGKELRQAWADYIISGGIPEVAMIEDEYERIKFLKLLASETCLGDTIKRNAIRKKKELTETLTVLASSTGKAMNPSRLAKAFEEHGFGAITSMTADRFVENFRESYIISCAGRYSIKSDKYSDSPYKAYFEDVGIRNAMMNFHQIEENSIMENIIYNELCYRGFRVDVGEVVVSVDTGRRDVNNHAIYAQKSIEVNFVVTDNKEKYYIQSIFSMGSPAKLEQEKKSLYSIDDFFKKIIVTRNEMQVMRDRKGVIIMDLFEFLLNESSLDN